MEENRILDTYYKAFGLIALMMITSSCSLMGIVVLNDPLTPEEHINLGVNYENKGELDAAVKEYKRASKHMPIAYLYIGNIYFLKNDFKNAKSSYKKAIKKTEDPRAYNNLAWLYYTMDKNLNGAEIFARKAVELSPQSQDFADTLNKIIEKKKNALDKVKTSNEN